MEGYHSEAWLVLSPWDGIGPVGLRLPPQAPISTQGQRYVVLQGGPFLPPAPTDGPYPGRRGLAPVPQKSQTACKENRGTTVTDAELSMAAHTHHAASPFLKRPTGLADPSLVKAEILESQGRSERSLEHTSTMDLESGWIGTGLAFTRGIKGIT